MSTEKKNKFQLWLMVGFGGAVVLAVIVFAAFSGGVNKQADGGVAGEVLEVKFVEVEALSLPVFVQVQREVECLYVLLAPVAVGGDFDAAKVGVVAVEVDAVGIFASASSESAWVHGWAKEQVVLAGQGVALQELK